MKKLVSACLIAVALLLTAAAPGDAREGRGGGSRGGHGGPGVARGASHWRGGHGHWRGGHAWHGHHHWHGPRLFVGIGPWWPGPWWYPPAYPSYVYAPPPVVVQQP